ncbi:MAG: DsbA family protein [Leptolyngbyaceae cyanobacterium bins.349]|nr:DsbA family protein [Leptolyngbyaceae cyanobacterium bins.349]
MDPIRISYFSDILCVWAYIAQIRLEELKANFQDQILIDYHFVSVFGNAREKLENRWRDRGGLKGYSDHVQEVVKKFNHITVHPDVWSAVTPASSLSCHVFLHAIQLLETKNIISPAEQAFERAMWTCRERFFVDLADISDRQVQQEIATSLGLPVAAIQEHIDNGEAHAQLAQDFDLVQEHTVTVSPTLIFNQGRQRLNGNVGYRVMEANLRELLHNPPGEQSWC